MDGKGREVRTLKGLIVNYAKSHFKTQPDN